jgi:hypothetical protein
MKLPRQNSDDRIITKEKKRKEGKRLRKQHGYVQSTVRIPLYRVTEGELSCLIIELLILLSFFLNCKYKGTAAHHLTSLRPVSACLTGFFNIASILCFNSSSKLAKGIEGAAFLILVEFSRCITTY